MLMHSKSRRWNIPIVCEYLFLKITSFPNNFEEYYLHVCCFGKLRNLSEIVWKPMATTEIESVYKIWRKRYPNKLLKTADLRPSKNNWERIHGWNLNRRWQLLPFMSRIEKVKLYKITVQCTTNWTQ